MQFWHGLTSSFFNSERNSIVNFNMWNNLLTTCHIFIELLQVFFLENKEGQKNIQDIRNGEEIKELSFLENLRNFGNLYILTWKGIKILFVLFPTL